MAIYQSESVIQYLKKGLEDGTVVMYPGEPARFVAQKDGLILPNGDLYDRGQSFYAWFEKPAAPAKPVEKPVEEPKVEEKPVEEPKAEAPAPKTRKPATKKAAE